MSARGNPRDGFVTVNGLKLHYLDWGNESRQTMLLVHGLQDCARSWDVFAHSMSKDYHVIAVDHRGHGDSQWSSEAAYKLKDYVSDISGIVDKLKLDNMVYVGHSAGGRNGMVYAASNPGKIARLVIVDIDPMGFNPESARSVTSYQAEPEEFASLDAVVDRLRQRAPLAISEILAHHAVHMTRDLGGGSRVWKRDRALLAAYERPELWDYYRRIRCPAIIVRGENSAILTAEVARQMVKELPGTELVELAGAGHWCYDDDPAGFESAARGFLRE